MSISNLFQKNDYDIYCDNLGDSGSPVENIYVDNINGAPYPGGGIPAAVPNKILRTNGLSVVQWGDVNPSNLTGGSVNDVLKTIAPGTVAWDPVKPGDITPGTANQIMHVKSDGSVVEFASNITIPGTLHVTGASTFSGDGLFEIDCQVTNDLNVINGDLTIINGDMDISVGKLKLNTVAGTNNQTIVSNGSGQSWSLLPPVSISPGTNGQYLTTSGGITTWASLATIACKKMRFYNNTVFNVNTGTNIFATNGVQQYNVGSPFTFDVGTGTFSCNTTGYYTWNFRTMLSTHDAQSKLLLSDGTNIVATCLTDYVAGLTTTQPFSFTATLPATSGQVWAFGFYSIGIGGTLNTSGDDPDFPGCPTTVLEIISTQS